MKVIGFGTTHKIQGDDLKTYDALPAATYKVTFSMMSGFSLEQIKDFTQLEDKVYGNHIQKLDKVFKSYESIERSLGVILSGDKGIGKSMFVQLLAIKGIELNLPVIICDKAYGGLVDFLQSIEQEAIIIFDEYEKNFPIEGDGTDQNEMLSLFDGMDQQKRMYAVTVNDLHKLSPYIKNRPGRFHYHLRFNYPTADEIEVYMKDKLQPEYYDEIKEVARFSALVQLNYDTLRAIAFELNQGYSFKEAISDLNILNTESPRYDFTLVREDGSTIVTDARNIDLHGNQESHLATHTDVSHDLFTRIDVRFNPKDSVINALGQIIISDNIKSTYYDEDDKVQELNVVQIIVEKQKAASLHYTV